MNYCIIGSQINALHATLLAASHNHKVTLFHHPDSSTHIIDPSHGIFNSAQKERLEMLYGPMVDVASPNQLSFWEGKLRPPFKSKRRLFMAGALGRTAFLELLSSRMALRFMDFTGDAKEERTMEDWLNRRLGGILSFHLYDAYSRSRWGKGISELSNTFARHHFYSSDEGDPIALGGTPESAYQRLSELVEKNQMDWHKCIPDKIEKNDDGSWRISFGESSVMHDGPLLLSLPPKQINRIFTLNKSIQVDLSLLEMKDLNLASLTLEGHHGVHDIHVLSEDIPFFRICFPYGHKERAYIHLCEPNVSDEAIINSVNSLGIGTVIQERGIDRNTLKAWSPIWTPGCLARHRRVTRYFYEQGVTFFGRQGCFIEMTLDEDIRYLNSIMTDTALDSAEHQRQVLDPDPRIADSYIKIGRIYR